MSRFPTTRRNQILAWTGAALAWGTTFVASRVEPGQADKVGEGTAGSTTSIPSAMPVAPETGLTIIRYRSPELAPSAEAFIPVAVPSPEPVPAAPPAPASSGS